LYLARKGLFKSRQLVLGCLSRDRTKIVDARIQLRGLSRGFCKGLAVAETGTLPVASRDATAENE
jgi:hypothetical protein